MHAVKVLLTDDNVDVFEVDEFGRTALYIASFHTDSVELVSLLLDNPYRIKLLETADDDGMTPLMSAALAGNTQILKYLLQQDGLGVVLRNKKGETALALAVAENNHDCVRILEQAELASF